MDTGSVCRGIAPDSPLNRQRIKALIVAMRSEPCVRLLGRWAGTKVLNATHRGGAIPGYSSHRHELAETRAFIGALVDANE